MDEVQIRTVICNEFKEKFAGCEKKGFEFLKAVNERLITQQTKTWDAKVVKHMTGSGPLYIRSLEEIPIERPEESDSSESLDSDSEFMSKLFHTDASNKSRSVMKQPKSSGSNPILIDEQDWNNDNIPRKSHEQYSSNDDNIHDESEVNYGSDSKSTPQMQAVNGTSSTTRHTTQQEQCPICMKFFNRLLINYHANVCAERSRACPASAEYAEIMFDISDSEDTDVIEDVPPNPKPAINSENENTDQLIERLRKRINDIKNTGVVEGVENCIHVTRKEAWQDYLEKRKSFWFVPGRHLKVRFVGEPAVDTGGPLREFFSGDFSVLR